MCDSGCDVDLTIAATVAVDGWDVVEVGVRRRQPRWAYTVGLCRTGQPELVMSGLEPGVAAGLLWLLAEQVAEGKPISDGDRVEFGDWTFLAFPVVRPGRLHRAEQYHRHTRSPVPFCALQLVYPDRRGVWPWELGCALTADDQPIAGLVAA